MRAMKAIKLLVVFICVCAAFVVGFNVRGNEAILDSVGLSSISFTQEKNPGMTVDGDTSTSLAGRTAEVQGVLEEDSLDSIDLDDTTTATLNSIVSTSGDPNMKYFTAEEFEKYQRDASKKYTGIGALFGEYQGSTYVSDVFPNSSAEAAGMQVGDIIVAIDGTQNDDGWTLSEVINAISNDAGGSANITWRRPNSNDDAGGKTYSATIACSDQTVDNITSEMHDKVGYIKVRQFTQETASSVSDAVSQALSKGAKALVLDLRNNPGGYLSQAIDIASLFNKSGVVVQVETHDGTTSRNASGSQLTDKPLVVIVNNKTAAAAEVLAGALQDNGRATLVGTTTMGKGSVQSVRELSFGGAIRFTAGRYKTAKGHDIDKVGISPTVSVSNSSKSSGDNQKRVALKRAEELASR